MIASQLLGKLPPVRQAVLKQFTNHQGDIIDTGLALYFAGPHSFTGEDVLELQGHGGQVVMDLLLNAVLKQGARLAAPGEFSQRAFLNGKMDLTQAEAVADLIEAQTTQAALSASRSLQGVFSRNIKTLEQEMMELRMYVEAAIDFPEEEVDFLSDGHVLEKIESLLAQIHTLLKGAKKGQMLREGMSVVIVGQPNAGKSSLLNCLTQQETAIVTPIAGTTRDLIKETIQIDGIPLHIIDTAGVRGEDADVVEIEGIKRAKQQQALADRILLVVDATQNLCDVETDILREHGYKVTIVMNKIDLANIEDGERDEKIFLCAKSGKGLDYLTQHLKKCMGFQGEESANFIARRRHLIALEKTLSHCQQAQMQLVKFKAGELVAQELRFAQDALGEIVGKVTTDDLLGKIFSSFCIGK